MNPQATSSLGLRFAAIVGWLRTSMAQRTVLDQSLNLLATFISGYLGRLVQRLDRIVLQFEAGTLRPITPRKPAAKTDRARTVSGLPRRKAWLVQFAPHAERHRGYVDALLNDPETQRLIEAAPQAGRILRPLAKMMGLDLPFYLKRPARVRPPTPPKPRAKKPPQEIFHYCPPPGIGEKPLPLRLHLKVPGLKFHPT